MKIGLYFGSFNPIHVGHLIIAQTLFQRGGLDQVWFVVSPQNPFKKQESLAHEHDRLRMVELAIDDNFQFRAPQVEELPSHLGALPHPGISATWGS